MSNFRLTEAFSVRKVLSSRGFDVTDENSHDNLLIQNSDFGDPIWHDVYDIFNSNKLRKELKNVLYKQKPIQSSEIKKLLSHPNFIKKYQLFDNTFEWFAGELMIRKFAALSASNGIKIKNIRRNSTDTNSGDFDTIVVLRNTKLAYFECKAGSFDAEAIKKCYERMLALNCEYAIFFCVENIDEEDIKWKTAKIKIPVVLSHFLNKISIKGHSTNVIYDFHNCYIIDMQNSVEDKIKTILRINSAKINQLHFGIQLDDETFENLGYEIKLLDEQNYTNIQDSKIKF